MIIDRDIGQIPIMLKVLKIIFIKNKLKIRYWIFKKLKSYINKHIGIICMFSIYDHTS